MNNWQEQLLDWLQLIRTERVGPRLFWQLLDRFGSASEALHHLPQMGLKAQGQPISVCPRSQAEQELKAHEKLSLTLLPAFDPRFSTSLKSISDCPPILSVAGSVDLFNKPTIGIVGGRNSSIHGRQLAETIAKDLSAAGWIIASGLARGIDGHAHKGALPGTIAVLAGGVNRIYPPEHQELYNHIVDGGSVVSEMPLSLFPGAAHFPRRNRIISGFSQGIVVVEAALKSGSLITARMALDQGRELFAVPGSPFDERSRGCNELLRQGAILCEGAHDVLAQNSPRLIPEQQSLSFKIPSKLAPGRLADPSPDLHLKLLNDLDLTPLGLEELATIYDDGAEVISTALLELELTGKIIRHANNRYSRVAS
jgi:DNA processing protein